MFTTLNQYIPIVIFAVSGLTLFSPRPEDPVKYPVWLYVFLTLGFLVPWVSVNYFRTTDLWLFSIQALTALLMMVVRFVNVSNESWLKSVVSLSLGVLFLHISLRPSLGIPLAISSEWIQCLTAASAIVAIYLLFGLPPLQMGLIDLGSEPNLKIHLQTTILFRFVIAYFFIAHIQGRFWFENIYELQPLITGFILLGLGFSRVVLRLQTSLYRILAYLGSSLVLAIVITMNFGDPGAISLTLIAVALLPFIVLLNVGPFQGDKGEAFFNVTNYYRFHPTQAKHFFQWLKIFLIAEGIVYLGLIGLLLMNAQYGTAVAALLALGSVISVVGDKQAFVPKARS